MIQIFQDPVNPEKFAVSATVTFWIDKILINTLSDELEKIIRAQAYKDLKSNLAVRKAVAEAASNLLLERLGVEIEAVKEKKNESTGASTSANGNQSVPEDWGVVSKQ
jgi:hypothetical protein